MSSMRLSTRRATNSAPTAASAAKKISEIASARTMTSSIRRAIAEIVPDQETETRAEACRYGRAPDGPARRRDVGAVVDDDEAWPLQHPERDLLDIAGERLADRVGQQIKRRAGLPLARFDRRSRAPQTLVGRRCR